MPVRIDRRERTLGYEGPITLAVDAPQMVAALGDAATGIVGILSKSIDDPNLAPAMKAAGDVVAQKWETLTSLPTLYGDGFPSGNQLFGLTNHAWANPIPVCLINDGQIEYKPWILPDVTP